MPATVNVEVAGGVNVDVNWTMGMNAQRALELARDQINDSKKFAFALQYYGATLGYMVFMINGTFDSFSAEAVPNYYWHFFVNDISQTVGIDERELDAGDRVKFSFDQYDPTQHADTVLGRKYKFYSGNG